MADVKELFNILEDASGNGIGLSQKQIGDAAAGANEAPVLGVEDSAGNMQHIKTKAEGSTAAVEAQPAFIAKDSSGNLTYLSLDAQGKLPVTGEAAGTCISGSNILDVGSVTPDVANDVVTLVLALTEDYQGLEFVGSATVTTMWEVVYIDDVGGTPAETSLGSFITGAGAYTHSIDLACREFSTVGGTGVQNLVLRGTPKKDSDLHGIAAVLQKA